jgi:hypothetical protein
MSILPLFVWRRRRRRRRRLCGCALSLREGAAGLLKSTCFVGR